MTAFNGGEVSPWMARRVDMDVLSRACSSLMNFDVSQMGGLSRRRGFRRVIAALDGSIMVPYVYSTADRFLVEVAPSLLRVLSVEGDVVASLPSVWTAADIASLRHKQVNSMLFLACPMHELMVLKRDDEGVFSLDPYEFKNRPWRYEEYRDFPVRMTLDDGCYRLSFGENSGEKDAATNEGDVMRVQVMVSQQTGFNVGAVIRQGWVVAKVFTAATVYATGKKLCVNEGSYWSWWTCDKDFNGTVDFVDGLTSPADYPDFFHKGIVCHSNVMTCKGAWTFYCYKEWYGTYAVERRFPDEEWQLLGTSNSKVGAASNVQITGDESEEECYLRLMLYESQVSNATDPSVGFVPDACGNKLVVDAYRKDVILQLRSNGRPATVQRFSIPATPTLRHYLSSTVSSIRASRVWVDGVEQLGASAVLTLGRSGIDVSPKGLMADALADGQTVRFAWSEPKKSGRIAGLDSRGMKSVFLPVGARFDVNVNSWGRGSVLRLTSFSSTDVQFTTVWESATEIYSTPSSGFYTLRVLNNKDSYLDAAECQGELSGVASGVVKPDVVPVPAAVATCDVLRFTLPLAPDAYYHFTKMGLPSVTALVVDGVRHMVQCDLVMDGSRLVVKPKGLTTDDVRQGSMVRVEWDVKAESFNASVNASTGSRFLTRFVPAGTAVTLKGWRSVYAGNDIVVRSGFYVCNAYSPPGNTSFSYLFNTLDEATYLVERDGFYVVSLFFWSEDNVKQRSSAKMEIPACTGHFEAEVSELTASAEYSLWDNVSTVPEGVPTSYESLMWSFAAFRGVYGFPSLVDVFQQRLVLAATTAQPQSVWMSRTDDLNNFEVGKQDDAGLAITLSTTTQNGICWLMAQGARLLLGTADAEWSVSGGQGVLSPTNARADNHGYVGSSGVPALMATDKVIYVERGGARVYQYGYDYESDGFVSRDLTVFADHVLAEGGGCRGIAFLRKPEPRAVFVRGDGVLALMTYNSMHEVHAWHRYVTEGRFEGVTALPNGSEADLLFALVARDDGRFIEVLGPENDFQDPEGRDYVSTLVTCSLAFPRGGRRDHGDGVMMCLRSESPVDGVEVSSDGEVWTGLDRFGMVPAGWSDLVSCGKWDFDVRAGVRVKGNRGFELLALQW